MTDTTPATTPKSPRKPPKPRAKKWASEIARKSHSEQRRKLARAAAERATAEIIAARQEMARAHTRLRNIEGNRRLNMVSNGLTPRLTAVMNSWGLRLPVNITPDSSISAYTDFSSITVNYDRRLTDYGKLPRLDANGNRAELPVVSDEDLRQIAAETRGLFYHELGHNLFTVPLPDLLTLAWLEGFAVDMNLANLTNDPGMPNYIKRQIEADSDVEAKHWPNWYISPRFHQAWNVMEDQRMETALVEESPQIASYLTVLVLRNIVGSKREQAGAHALVHGRKYLPASVRAEAKARWADEHRSVDPNALAAIVDRYILAATPIEMVQAIVDYVTLTTPLSLTIDSFDDHSPVTHQTRRSTRNPMERVEKLADTAEKNAAAAEKNDDDEGDEEGESIGSASDEMDGDDEEGDGEGEDSPADSGDPSKDSTDDDDEEADDEEADEPGTGVGSGHREEPVRSKDDYRDALEDALDDLDDDEAIGDDVRAMNDSYNIDEGALPTYSHSEGEEFPEELINHAHIIVDDLVRSFNIATADCAPHWESGQRRGVLEAIRYRTRQPGDMEFFRQYTDSGEPGTDISVSIFLDVSYSMNRYTQALSAAAWASKVACQQINVDCDVTLFDEGAWSLWGTDEFVTDIPSVGVHGGTNPQAAFDAMLTNERDKKHHLVLIMTDGAWTDPHVLRSHRHSNMRTMVFNFSDRHHGMSPNVAMANRLSADEAFNINDLLDIPKALESMLIGLV